MTGLITWIPSFEWEDFFASATEDSRAAEMESFYEEISELQFWEKGKAKQATG